MRDLVKKDRARTQISRISQFGLLEMSRQRLRQSFIEWKSELSHSSIAQKIFYQINEAINTKKTDSLIVQVSPFIHKYIFENYGNEISNIEKVRKVALKVIENPSLDNNNALFENLPENKNKIKKKISKKTVKTAKKSKVKKSKPKIKENKKVKSNEKKASGLKEIKNKKTGWWQK